MAQASVTYLHSPSGQAGFGPSGCMIGDSVLLSLLVAAVAHGSHAPTVDDGAALLQSSLRQEKPARMPSGLRHLVDGRAIADMITDAMEEEVGHNQSGLVFPWFDCERHPTFCKEPFNCNTLVTREAMRWLEEGIGSNGPSPSAMCNYPAHELYIEECLVNRNLLKAAHVQYFMVRQELKEEGDYESDASLCFLEGLCAEDSITENSTMEDSVAVCDRRYGRREWASFGSKNAGGTYSLGAVAGEVAYSEGLSSRWQSIPFALSSCATGTFHCDVMLCKETYCKDPHAISRYAAKMDEIGWVSPHRK
mmetsp:Transcript_108293/g.263218  ORF Transcript_108293/g.263218 Transcript_108293/m.263218 type:complete len:307 (+) Transcript_108293:1-921(+)